MRITLIGSGNVATHLGAALKNAGHYIVQVYSRNPQNAALLAYHLKAEAISDISEVNPDTDLFIISTADDAIDGIAAQLAYHQIPIVHTSGATPIQVLLKHTEHAGVFYPLQTFSKTKEVDFHTVPLCVEGAYEHLTAMLKELAQTISNNVDVVSSDKRKILHLSAVFACNFPNYLYYTAQQLLAAHHLDFNLLRPLIIETAEKVQVQFPANVQTGPAIRNDKKTMEAHIGLLNNEPVLKEIYELLSQCIIKMGEGQHRVE
ncbi:Rossmann-like and DUF2520 domain-containing protein [Mucilaginibacter terrae]|uniref:Short-subunit dehydrogenase-like oxidoreductase (DUF2520 family) n=1 Tax=Mucilaginibacter terrae TaxID=1955052 RepID=A0ABU3H0Y1_9SPHI|nr:Rossmann-like and DUF2520 domain-containing protein [Mucilaginibacter terrae]MDT3405659.1 putative short-subunit dehydrogenase-like oxidoreductase (DUF2520 family) [Mucilaginibacter terrae]